MKYRRKAKKKQRIKNTTQENVATLERLASKSKVKSPPGRKKEANAEWVTVTPQKAAEWLKTAQDNYRNVSEKTVLSYAIAMENGEWGENGETIKFDSEGRMWDGQHRLHAVVLADAPVKMLVVYNVEDQRGVDVGKNRTLGDYLKNQDVGVTSSNTLAEAIRFLWELQHGKYSGKKYGTIRPSHSALLEFMEKEHPNLPASVEKCKPKSLLPRGHIAGYHCLFSRYDVDMANEFAEALRVSDELYLDSKDPVKKLRDKLIKDAMKTVSKMPRKTKTATAISAWNYWVDRKTPKSLRLIDEIPEMKGVKL